jgi:uncharacterized membrane protein YfcA
MFIAVGAVTGVLAAVFGFGGGVVVVPILFICFTYWQKVPADIVMHMAVATSLSIMIITASNSAFAHFRKGNLVPIAIKNLALPIAVGAIAGAIASHFLHSTVLRYFFIVFLIYTIISALLKKGFTKEYKLEHFSLPKKTVTLPVGFVTGLISVLLGIGGSVITMPFFRRCKMPMNNAAANASALTLAVAIVGAIAYVLVGLHAANLPKYSFGYLYLPAFIGISAGTFIGVPVGIKLSKLVPDAVSAKLYIVLLIIVLLAMVV